VRGAAEAESVTDAFGVCSQRGVGVDDAPWLTRCAARGDDERITLDQWREWAIRRSDGFLRRCHQLGASRADDCVGGERQRQLASRGCQHALVERQCDVTLMPDATQSFYESAADWHVDGNQLRHGAHAIAHYRAYAMTTPAQWVSGARPRTLPAAVVPVVVGVAVAVDVSRDGETAVATSIFVVNGLLALVVSLALQVAVNYANDYSDGVRGTDERRSGPLRLVASGAATASAVKRAAMSAFVAAGVAGLVLAARTSWWLIPLGLVCMIAGWTYTGGPRPYGYAGFGEVFVFVFFGLIATAGTTYVIVQQVSRLSVVSGGVAGFLATALLVVNNIRDITTDRESGKRTLAVRLGARRARLLYVLCYFCTSVAVVIAALDVPLALIGLVGLLAALPAIATVRSATSAGELIRALGMTARVQLVVGALYALGIIVR